MTTDVAKAIHKINPEAGFVIKNNDVNQIEWNEERADKTAKRVLRISLLVP